MIWIQGFLSSNLSCRAATQTGICIVICCLVLLRSLGCANQVEPSELCDGVCLVHLKDMDKSVDKRRLASARSSVSLTCSFRSFEESEYTGSDYSSSEDGSARRSGSLAAKLSHRPLTREVVLEQYRMDNVEDARLLNGTRKRWFIEARRTLDNVAVRPLFAETELAREMLDAKLTLGNGRPMTVNSRLGTYDGLESERGLNEEPLTPVSKSLDRSLADLRAQRRREESRSRRNAALSQNTRFLQAVKDGKTKLFGKLLKDRMRQSHIDRANMHRGFQLEQQNSVRKNNNQDDCSRWVGDFSRGKLQTCKQNSSESKAEGHRMTNQSFVLDGEPEGEMTESARIQVDDDKDEDEEETKREDEQEEEKFFSCGFAVIRRKREEKRAKLKRELILRGDISDDELGDETEPVLEESEEQVAAKLSSGWDALTWSAHLNHLSITKKLLNAGVHGEYEDPKTGWTALMWAVHNNNQQTVRALLKEGRANVNHCNRFGATALMWAARQNKLESVKILLQAGADINAAGNDGNSALTWSARAGHVDMTALLVKSGAAVNHRNLDGETALMGACVPGHVQVVETLLRGSLECDTLIENNFSQDALALAQTFPTSANHKAIVKMVEERNQLIQRQLEEEQERLRLVSSQLRSRGRRTSSRNSSSIRSTRFGSRNTVRSSLTPLGSMRQQLAATPNSSLGSQSRPGTADQAGNASATGSERPGTCSTNHSASS